MGKLLSVFRDLQARREERRARALRREDLERREFQDVRKKITGSDDPADLFRRKK